MSTMFNCHKHPNASYATPSA